jgi:hypothetical protein
VCMPFPIDLEAAKQRLLEAQAGLEAYLVSEDKDILRHKQLAEGLRRAIDDFLNQLIKSSPSW